MFEKSPFQRFQRGAGGHATAHTAVTQGLSLREIGKKLGVSFMIILRGI